MRGVVRGLRRLVALAIVLFAGAMLYWAFIANVPTARVRFRLPPGTGGEVRTPLEPMAPNAQENLCETRGVEWTCNVRQTFWQNPLSPHKTGHIVLGIRDPRQCQRPDMAPRQVSLLDAPTVTVEATPMAAENCTARWDLRVQW